MSDIITPKINKDWKPEYIKQTLGRVCRPTPKMTVIILYRVRKKHYDKLAYSTCKLNIINLPYDFDTKLLLGYRDAPLIWPEDVTVTPEQYEALLRFEQNNTLLYI